MDNQYIQDIFNELALSLSRLMNRKRYKNVSSKNRFVTAYLYDFDQNLSPNNRFIGAELENNNTQEGSDETKTIFKEVV